MKNEIIHINNIQHHIFNIRGAQVMLDRDLAVLYNVSTSRLNEQVKRNIERFPSHFMFQLNKEELENWMSQIAITNKEKMGIRRMPYVFTEQGISMLSAVLRSKTAIDVSIQIMDAFVQMRKFISTNANVFQRLHNVEQKQIESDANIEKIFKALEAPDIKDKQGVFFDGQIYDAYQFVNNLIKKAKTSIILIDNYIDDTVITQLTSKHKEVKEYLLSKNFSKKLQLDIAKANQQYPTFKSIPFAKAHDRFLIIDKKEVYHLGASLKDLGKKWFAFSKMELGSISIIQELEELV